MQGLALPIENAAFGRHFRFLEHTVPRRNRTLPACTLRCRTQRLEATVRLITGLEAASRKINHLRPSHSEIQAAAEVKSRYAGRRPD